MIVMKFGGTSVGGAVAIRQVVAVVREQLQRRPVVVVSAHAGVTDALFAAVRAVARGEGDDCVEAIVTRHRQILTGLGLDDSLLDDLLHELQDLARGVRLVGEASRKAVDAMVSFGERLSARVVAAALVADGVAACAVDAFAAGLITDSAFGRARPLPDEGRLGQYLEQVDGVPIVTGFLGADRDGNITTLGRNGSDFSAAWIAVAIGAEEIQVWKDVDGVHTADPRLVAAARPIPNMSFAEVADLASFGSKVLHPAAMVPAMQHGVPLYVRNTLRPEVPGTRIDATVAQGERPAVRAIAHRCGAALVTVRSHRLLPQHVFLAKVFDRLAGIECDVGPVAVGEAAVTIALEAARAPQAAGQLVRFGDVQVEDEQAVVGVIGDAAQLEQGGAAEVLSTLARAGIEVRCAGLGAVGSTVAVVVSSEHLDEALALLHARFLER